MAEHAEMARHPDIVALRERYDLASSTPVAQVVEGLTLIAAVYLAASPWIVGFHGLATITGSDLITGGALAALAAGFSVTYGRLHGINWVVPAAGLWTIIAPWSVAGHADVARTIWSNAFAGGVVVVLGCMMMVIGAGRVRRFGR
jgi:hypothetical protein